MFMQQTFAAKDPLCLLKRILVSVSAMKAISPPGENDITRVMVSVTIFGTAEKTQAITPIQINTILEDGN